MPIYKIDKLEWYCESREGWGAARVSLSLPTTLTLYTPIPYPYFTLPTHPILEELWSSTGVFILQSFTIISLDIG